MAIIAIIILAILLLFALDRWQIIEVFRRDNFTCVEDDCNRGLDSGHKLEPHHIQPSSKGGGDELGNLETRCMEHHEQVHRDRGDTGSVNLIRWRRKKYGDKIKKR